MNSIVLITGATSGIGESCARKFAAHQHDLIITGRRMERLINLAEELVS
ncbi:MAG: SDR family NAD(P)-dependent oxidoreductase, partial [Bacteroidetes bacterium]|nr:SDR family NAD(P)-dependent oxidoreductase [Bacteroidota bacterium]